MTTGKKFRYGNASSFSRRRLLAGALAATHVRAAQRAPRPNAVFILMDDLRADELHCTGHPFLRTPNIDRIAAEGVTFRNAFVTTPLCSPSRACFLTGQYAHTHGVIDNTDHSTRSHQLKTFPAAMQRVGYRTGFVGKWHMGVDDSPRPGFDRWVSFQGQGTYINPELNVDGKRVPNHGYGTDVINEYASEFLSARSDKPFLLYLAHKAVHPELAQAADGSVSDPNGGTFLPAERDRNLYARARYPRRPSAGVPPKDKPALERPGQMQSLGPATGTDDETIRNRARMMRPVDDGVGNIFRILEKSGRLDDTILVFTSDEGYFFGEHGLSFERRLAYEESIRIPLLIRYPRKIRPGSTQDAMALNIDLAPSILEWTGCDALPGVQGRSLAGLWHGEGRSWRKSFLVEYFSDHVFARMSNMGYQCVRTERWKYIRYTDLHGADELYDLNADPYETRNLIADRAAGPALRAAEAELNRLVAATSGRRNRA